MPSPHLELPSAANFAVMHNAADPVFAKLVLEQVGLAGRITGIEIQPFTVGGPEELDGTSVHLKAGDVLVQRGTIHNWVNKGTAPCVIAFAQVAAKPVNAGGKVLKAVG